MKDFNPAFGPQVAARYDDEPRGDEAAAAAFLQQAANGGRALEFAIGTGRIALPLRSLGVDVTGIELSTHMVERLRAKEGGADIDVTIGDMAATSVDGQFSLVYLVFNTISNLLTQDEQVSCFRNAAAHLAPGGVFVVELAVPETSTTPSEYVRPEWIGTGAVGLDVCRYDRASQILQENHVRLAGDGIEFAPIVQRLIYPAEMDLMAQIAGLRLAKRYGGWEGEPFTSDSKLHVSVYQRD